MVIRKPDDRDYELVAKIFDERFSAGSLVPETLPELIKSLQAAENTWDGFDVDAGAYVQVHLLEDGTLRVGVALPHDASVRDVAGVAVWICARILEQHPDWEDKAVWGSIGSRFGVDKDGKRDAGERGMKAWVAALSLSTGEGPKLEVPNDWMDPAVKGVWASMYRAVWTLKQMAARSEELHG